jgi:hypothetical protein
LRVESPPENQQAQNPPTQSPREQPIASPPIIPPDAASSAPATTPEIRQEPSSPPTQIRKPTPIPPGIPYSPKEGKPSARSTGETTEPAGSGQPEGPTEPEYIPLDDTEPQDNE